MSPRTSKPKLTIVTPSSTLDERPLHVGPLVRAAAATAVSLEATVPLMDSVSVLILSVLRAGQLFPEWAEGMLAGREDLLDTPAKLLVAKSLIP